MVYESSYESGRKPFVPDPTRGSWSSPSDFIYVSLGLAFKLELFAISWFMFVPLGIHGVIPYLICLLIFVVPIVVIQSFMGQFSSSGFISAFRISPLFKGMGYISLALNITILIYYSLFATIPLLFLLNSVRPTLPWSCEGMQKWYHAISTEERINLCNSTTININETLMLRNETYSHYLGFHIPSVLYFKSMFGSTDILNSYSSEFSMSWELFACSLITWSIIAGVFYKCFNTQKLGIILRYAIWGTLVLLIVCLLRFSFLPGVAEARRQFISPDTRDIAYEISNVPIYAMSAFGAGWGTVVTLASFNPFKTNIMSYSWIICVGQMVIFMAFGFVAALLESHFTSLLPKTDTEDIYVYIENNFLLFLSGASAIAGMEWPHMWSIIYYSMLTMATLIVLVTQLLSVLTSVFDEFEGLRTRKLEVTFGLIGFLALSSLYFCSSDGMLFFSAFSVDTLFTQTALNLLLIFVVLWVYGRERFQRDMEFMMGQRFATWKVNMLRFVAPICLLIVLFASFLMAYFEHMFASTVMQIATVLLIVLPWLFIPGYCVFIMLQTTGSIKRRFVRSSRPTDWYPIDAKDRQRYEEAMGNVDITHQLNEVEEDVY